MTAPPIKHRRSARLTGFDYTNPGAYFVTICTFARACFLNDVHLRRIVEHSWRTVVVPNASLEAGDLVVMPNHVHGIVWVSGTAHSPTTSRTSGGGPPRGSLGAIVGSFKAVATRRINRERRTPQAPVWQRGYYDRVVRSERELDRIRLYIIDNPTKWSHDVHNPQNLPRDLGTNPVGASHPERLRLTALSPFAGRRLV
jgi:REP element-mobilizing transposase RayT